LYSALGPVWAETRVQSGDWYGSGTLHPGQVLRGTLPLLSPAFSMFPLFTTRCLHVRHDVRDPSGGSVNCGRECFPVIFAEMTTSTPFRLSFTCRKSTTWDRRLYFPSEGRRAEDFFALKNRNALAGFEPANLGTKGQHATPRPPKPLMRILQLNLKWTTDTSYRHIPFHFSHNESTPVQIAFKFQISKKCRVR